ncbi:hypothetical protein HK104_007088, partial [Borealophlyctis nickersoniae]
MSNTSDLYPFTSTSPLSRCMPKIGCCLPCPATSAFYPEGSVDRVLRIAAICRVVSFIACLAVVISYLVLPDKRVHPRILVLFFSVAMLAWQAMTITGLSSEERKKTFCADVITQSSQGTNLICGLQAVVAVYAGLCLACWSCTIIVNLHLVISPVSITLATYFANAPNNISSQQTVWQSQLLSRHTIPLHLICWGFPLLFVIPAVSLNSIQYAFGSLCFIVPQKAHLLFFYPATCIIAASFVIHSCTSVWIWIVKRRVWKAKKEKRRAEEAERTERYYAGVSGSQLVEVHHHGLVGVEEDGHVMVERGDGSALASGNGAYRVGPHAGITMTGQDGDAGAAAAVNIVGIAAMQWRILLLSFGLLAMFLTYWGFYRSDVPRLIALQDPKFSTVPTTFQRWFVCIILGHSVDQCADLVSSHVPSLWKMAAAEGFLSLGGVIVFVAFFCTPRIWNEWATYFRAKGWVRGKKGAETV